MIALEQIDLIFGQNLSKDENVSLFLATLLHYARQGHLCITLENMEEPLKEKLTAAIPNLPSFVVCHNNRYYLQKNWEYERVFLENIERLSSVEVIKKEAVVDDSLSEEQKEAVAKALGHPLSIITGGPGTGKTFTAGQIVKAIGSEKTLLMAPTGKAAARLSESINAKCGTIHSLYKSAQFADLIIVDECSMIDAQMFPKLLSSIPSGCRLVLMGDPAQLPSVEGGSFFSDLIELGTVPFTRLKRNFRSENNGINDLAFSILENDPEVSFKELEKFLVKADIMEYVRKDFRILCCMRQGPRGADNLNKMILETLSEEKEEIEVPILITRNDYELGLYNGEMGTIKKDSAYFAGNKKFLVSQLPSYEYGYCISVHKSQGSEYEKVLLLVPPGSEVFGKEMLYTAVTRAKNQLKIEGSPETIKQMLAKKNNRMSGIK